MKTVERAEARRLRSEGRPMRDIERVLGVSRSSVSRSVGDIELTEGQRETLRVNGGRKRSDGRREHFRAKRRACQDQGRAAAKHRDALHACRLSVHSTAIVQHIYGAIQEYAGFDRAEWLG